MLIPEYHIYLFIKKTLSNQQYKALWDNWSSENVHLPFDHKSRINLTLSQAFMVTPKTWIDLLLNIFFIVQFALTHTSIAVLSKLKRSIHRAKQHTLICFMYHICEPNTVSFHMRLCCHRCIWVDTSLSTVACWSRRIGWGPALSPTCSRLWSSLHNSLNFQTNLLRSALRQTAGVSEVCFPKKQWYSSKTLTVLYALTSSLPMQT